LKKICVPGGASVVTVLPDPSSCTISRSFRSNKGGVGSKTEVNLGFVWQFSGNRGWNEPGLDSVSDRKNRILIGRLQKVRRSKNGIFPAANLFEKVVKNFRAGFY
jgi:hypothetical protein